MSPRSRMAIWVSARPGTPRSSTSNGRVSSPASTRPARSAVVSRADDAPLPLGARLASCDGKPADALAAENVGAFEGRWFLKSRHVLARRRAVRRSRQPLRHPARDLRVRGRRSAGAGQPDLEIDRARGAHAAALDRQPADPPAHRRADAARRDSLVFAQRLQRRSRLRRRTQFARCDRGDEGGSCGTDRGAGDRAGPAWQ